MTQHLYAIALGSNRGWSRHRLPEQVVAAALQSLHGDSLGILAASAIITSAPLGPSRRRYANAVAIVQSSLCPDALLARLKQQEKAFGRRGGQRWGARTLDLDIALWSGGLWNDRALTVPHKALAVRAFVLRPLAGIAPHWPVPRAGATIRHLNARLHRAKPVDRKRAAL